MVLLQSRKVTNFTPSARRFHPVRTANYRIMEEGKRQKQIAGLLNEEMNTIFQRLGLSMIDGGMVSISSVKVTPDLLEARFYLSFFQVKNVEAALEKIEDRHHEIKKELAARVRHQLRSIPVLRFYKDDTLDQVFKMEEIFKKIEEEKKGNSGE
jgi:ribosome-binding factor A